MYDYAWFGEVNHIQLTCYHVQLTCLWLTKPLRHHYQEPVAVGSMPTGWGKRASVRSLRLVVLDCSTRSGRRNPCRCSGCGWCFAAFVVLVGSGGGSGGGGGCGVLSVAAVLLHVLLFLCLLLLLLLLSLCLSLFFLLRVVVWNLGWNDSLAMGEPATFSCAYALSWVFIVLTSPSSSQPCSKATCDLLGIPRNILQYPEPSKLKNCCV